MNRFIYREDAITNSGLNVQLFQGIYLIDLIKLKCKEDLSLNLVKGYLQ